MDRKYQILKHPRFNDILDGDEEEPVYNKNSIYIEDWYNVILPDFDTLRIYNEQDLKELFEKEKQNGGTKNEN